MSNEELVILIQGGESSRLIELWQQTRRMALKEAVRWASYHSNGVEMEDLEQSAFIALMRAVDSFDPTAGAGFATWYYRFVKGEYQRATGLRTEKQRRDPLNAATSLDAPVTDSEDMSLGDTISDPYAESAIADVDRREDLRRLHTALDAAIATLPSELQSVIRDRYYRGEVVDANAHSKAMRMLRAPKCSQALRAYLTYAQGSQSAAQKGEIP